MKLWLIEQDINNGYDTYDAAVVAAPDADTARRMHPSGQEIWEGMPFSTWASSAEQVTVTYLGIAESGRTQGVICASFNAG